jgi:demethylmenaquinone methyltransferase/2-methoxy-6-polyprenyl-1,4-benzoquinol methylase
MQDAGYVRDAFAGIARRYKLANHVLSLGIDVLWRRRVSTMVAARRPRALLDLATGSGDLLAALEKRCDGALIVGADFSLPMMGEARRAGHRRLVAADGLALPFADSAFDAVTVAFGLRNMADWPGALAEMRRVLKPGGSLWVLDFSLPRLAPLRQAHLFYLKHVMPVVAGWLTGKPEAYRYLCASIERFPAGEDMLALLRDAGFPDCEAETLSFGIASIYRAGRA